MTEAAQFSLPLVLGGVVHAERTARGLTQVELAARAALHPMALSKIERGVQQDIGITTVAQLARALSTPDHPITASVLLHKAEQWQQRLQMHAVGGTLPVNVPTRRASPGEAVVAGVLTGAIIAGLVLLIAAQQEGAITSSR